MRILLFEENGNFNENDRVQKGLKQYGYTVDRLSAKDSLRYIKKESFEVILLDLSLSQIESSIVREIRAKDIKTPILILNSFTSTKNKVQTFDSGADDYLIKPIDLDVTLKGKIVSFSRLLELIQKNIHKRDALEFIQDIALQVAKHLLTPDQFNSLLYYISQEGESKNFEQFYSSLAEALPNYREDIMTLAQQLEQKGLKKGLEQGRKEGREEGREEGRHEEAIEIAKKLLDEGRSPGAVQKLTGLSEKEIMNLVDKH